MEYLPLLPSDPSLTTSQSALPVSCVAEHVHVYSPPTPFYANRNKPCVIFCSLHFSRFLIPFF